MTYPTKHLCITHLVAAIDALYAAKSELRNGPYDYRGELMEVSEVIEILEKTLKDVRDLDELRDPEAQAERKAWDRQTRPNWGPL